MQFKELFREKEFFTIFGEVEAFSKNILEDYNDKLEKGVLATERKEIFDAIWGNIEFSGGEICVLDSPLLQRLRKIKQLGLAYYVYCGCDYSRFNHTVGITYLADRMAVSINKNDLGLEEERKKYFKEVVRLAAIFHDTGHMFLSHVSEHYFGKSTDYKRSDIIGPMLNQFEKRIKKKISFHEVLSCMIVNTEEVRRLLKLSIDSVDDITINAKHIEEDLNCLVEYISGLIVGIPIDRSILPYASIINGPIDADKCDYLSRDSHVTRVPVAVDVSRLTQKLSVVAVNDINKSDLWQDETEEGCFYELAMKDSAEKALFQLCIARTIMYDSVYYHHKVLTAETEFRNILNTLSKLHAPVFDTFTEILHYTDEDFNKYFFEMLKSNRDANDSAIIDRVSKQLKKLYNREFAKRVICIMPDYLTGSQSKKESLYDSILTVIDSPDEKALITRTKEEYILIRSLFQMSIKEVQEINVFVIQAPINVFGHGKIQVPIDLKDGNKRDFKGYELVSSRETSSSASYIVTDESEKLLIYFALEKVLFKDYGILIKSEAISCGKYNQKAMNSKYKELFMLGYFDDTPKLLKDDFIRKIMSESKISKIVEEYAAYEGPKGYKVTEEGVKNFFRQVICTCKDKEKSKIIADGIYRLMDNALFINREYLTINLEKKLAEIESMETLYVVPLGSMLDSAKHMTYFWNDIESENLHIETEKSLEEILMLPDVDSIFFFDDGSFSGVQLTSIMQEYMGIPKENRKTEEEHVDELPDDLRTKLKDKKIICFFIAFNKANEQIISKELRKIGLENVQFLFIEDMTIKYLEENKDKIFENEEQRVCTKEFLDYVGFEIMDSIKKDENGYKKGWDAERVKRAALGYNDAQQMVFLKSSVPTYTITAFWQEGGTVGGYLWEPLFRRTKKRKKRNNHGS